ncbi:uncharacterized protein LOC112692452 [Sipha flava]|uniref:Uncharacterized protein LOC112692452 n=1 Tax=Sipha flava TaxID=143950 RepID=A0A8B8GJ12_9HEMI|nr:uncharacterized protein LOC112692452 [Sipha flava]
MDGFITRTSTLIESSPSTSGTSKQSKDSPSTSGTLKMSGNSPSTARPSKQSKDLNVKQYDRVRNPFTSLVQTDDCELQQEAVELKNDRTLQLKFKEMSLNSFWGDVVLSDRG